MTDIQALRANYRSNKASVLGAMEATAASTRGIHAALRKLSAFTDDLLQALWQRADFPEGCALVAVGGYGRAQLFPYSDVDVLLLLPEGATPQANSPLSARIEGFIGSCWDAGLEIGASVRSVAECLRESAANVTVQTALLESRQRDALACTSGRSPGL